MPVRRALFFFCVFVRASLLDEASCLGVEERVGSGRAQWPRGSGEAADVVIGRELAIGRRGRLLGRVSVLYGRRHCGRGAVETKGLWRGL